jgi:hypothetical protein
VAEAFLSGRLLVKIIVGIFDLRPLPPAVIPKL